MHTGKSTKNKARFALLSTKNDSGIVVDNKNNTNLNCSSKEIFENTFDNLEDTNMYVQQHPKSNQTVEFDAFQTYLNDDKDKENKIQATQFFQNTQVIQQIDSIVMQESNNQQSPEKLEMRKSLEKLGDLFNDNSREEFERFFNQVQHSISIMGSEVEQPDEKIVEVIDVLFCPDNEIIETTELKNDNTGINSSFSSVIKQVLLANASKNVSLTKALNYTLTTQIASAKFNNLGPFYGLPTRVKDLIKMYKGIEQLYEWQDECLNLPALTERKNLIYALPTSGGKTLVAEILIFRELLCYKRNAIFILPYVSIVQEKVWALSPFAVALDFLVEEYAANKGVYPPRKRRRKNSIYIATIEKALGLLNSLIETNRIHEIGLIVVDELHLVGESGRGATLEGLLTKIRYIQADIHVVGMSATIGNVNELCQFLDAEIYSQNFRPVELTEYVKCGTEIAKINWNNDEDELLTFVRNDDFGYCESASLIDPDRLGGLVSEIIPKGSCLIFCPSKKNCENVAYLLCRVLNKQLIEYKKAEKEQVRYALKDETGSLCKIFEISIQFGIAYHHSGLTNEERRIIEDAFRSGVLSVICCTSTLAAGVNLPAERVILRQPYIGREFINLSRYKQMVGRAGRAGLKQTGDSILICNQQDLAKVKKLLMSPMDRALSNLHELDGRGLRHLLLSCVSLGIANTRLELQEVTKKTLLSIQSKQLGVDLKHSTDKAISDLFKLGAIQEADLSSTDQQLDVSVIMDTTINSSMPIMLNEIKKRRRVVIKNDTKLVVSKLGCAAIKGNFELTRAHQLYDDLHQAQRSLVLLDALHLLYLVTPYDIAEQIRPNKTDYYSIYCRLTPNELHTAKILGIDDSVAMKMLSNQQIKNVSEQVLNRFYLTLILYDLWNEKAVFEVAEKFQIDRGIVQNLMTSSATFASNIVNFCEGLDEFWTFAHLIKGMSQRLSHCCVRELLPLMELPAVKQSRARQLYNAGFKTLQSIAKANANSLIETIEFMPRRVANQLIAAAKMLLLEKVENLREEAEDVLDGVDQTKPLNQSVL